jgi:hypothetical protein
MLLQTTNHCLSWLKEVAIIGKNLMRLEWSGGRARVGSLITRLMTEELLRVPPIQQGFGRIE